MTREEIDTRLRLEAPEPWTADDTKELFALLQNKSLFKALQLVNANAENQTTSLLKLDFGKPEDILTATRVQSKVRGAIAAIDDFIELAFNQETSDGNTGTEPADAE